MDLGFEEGEDRFVLKGGFVDEDADGFVGELADVLDWDCVKGCEAENVQELDHVI